MTRVWLPGPVQAVDGLPNAKEPNVLCARRTSKIEQPAPRDRSTARGRGQPARKKSPTRSEPACHEDKKHSPTTHERARHPAQQVRVYVVPGRPPSLAQKHVGLDVADAQQRQRREEKRDEQAKPSPCATAPGRKIVAHVRRQARREIMRRRKGARLRQRDAEQTSQPARARGPARDTRP